MISDFSCTNKNKTNIVFIRYSTNVLLDGIAWYKQTNPDHVTQYFRAINYENCLRNNQRN